MLKKIEDVVPLLATRPYFLLFKCPPETQEKVSQAKLKFEKFDDIKMMEKHIKNIPAKG